MTAQTLLDLEAIAAARMHSSPYRWTTFDRTFRRWEDAVALRDTFPDAGFMRFARMVGSKRHDLNGRVLIEKGTTRTDEVVPPLWRRLAEEIKSDEYRASLSQLTGVRLDGLGIEVTLWRKLGRDFIDPHPDNGNKVVVHLMYFGDEAWRHGSGGCLRILRSRDLDDVAAEIPPRLNHSVVFVRSENSWHGYRPVESPSLIRLAVQVVFHRPGLEYTGYEIETCQHENTT